jgi:hypothetical protein
MQDTLVKCDGVPAGAVTTGGSGTLDEVAFGFRLADHRLVNLTTISAGLAVPAAMSRFNGIAAALDQALGTPTRQRRPSGPWDASGPAIVEYRYADYIATVSAMELPGRGLIVREHYVSARDDGQPRAAPKAAPPS